jgi:hypothetical protein
MHFQTVEESFHYDRYTPLPGRSLERALEIKKPPAICGIPAETDSAAPAIQHPARIGHQLAAYLVNRKNQAFPQESRSDIIAGPEPGGVNPR